MVCKVVAFTCIFSCSRACSASKEKCLHFMCGLHLAKRLSLACIWQSEYSLAGIAKPCFRCLVYCKAILAGHRPIFPWHGTYTIRDSRLHMSCTSILFVNCPIKRFSLTHVFQSDYRWEGSDSRWEGSVSRWEGSDSRWHAT